MSFPQIEIHSNKNLRQSSALIGYMVVYCIHIFTLSVGLAGAGQYEQRFSILGVFLSMLFGEVLFVGLDILHSKIRYVWPYTAVLSLLLVLNNIGGATQLRNVWSGWDLSVTNDIVDIKVLDDCYNLYLEEAAEEANVFNYGHLYFFNRVVL